MSTIQIEIKTGSAEQSEILIAELSEINFYAFQEEANCLSAFIREEDFDETELNKIISSKYISCTKSFIKDTNWNAKWESEFEPIIINDFVAVRAAFHKPVTNVKYEIIITPKMSFGTGHHATTYLMLQQMQHIDFTNKTVLDFGTGTGILAILAKKSGAKKVLAIDNDAWSINNARENFAANNCADIILLKKDNLDPDSYREKTFDIILANINLNVIIGNSKQLTSISRRSTMLLLSGFLLPGEQTLYKNFISEGFEHKATIKKDAWISLLLIKS